ncbi:DUF1573 domain-containing protein [Puia sp.]|uniref:DUF1573 domain-containing protein n=1 Tax=Puia sp. TaxID=2045100 RepID=UPI002F41FD59
MYRFISACLLTALFAGCNGDQPNAGISPGSAQFLAMRDTARFTTIQWIDSTRDYGKIPEGQKLDVAFRFRNTGTTPLVIGRVQPSCGCTIADPPREPIAPGAEGVIKASFNSEGRTGINHKTLMVTSNTRGSQSIALQFVVEVIKKAS